MFRHLLHITGIEEQLQSLKMRIEDQAQRLIQQSKAAAIQMAIAAGLVFGAAIVALMATVAGLVALYLWLVPLVGNIAAAGIVAGGLLLIAIVLGISAMVVARRKLPEPELTKAVEPAPVRVQVTENAPASPASSGFAPSASFTETSPRPVSAHDVESLFAVTGQFARLPRTGIEPADNVLRALAPQAEEATREAVARAANLIRYGDRSTMLGILGAATAVGWILSKTATSNR
jgi:hypothetical protein